MIGNKGEVMWPRLVASKVLRKRSGSNNFIADFPSIAEALTDFPSLSRSSLMSNNTLFDHRKSTDHGYKVFVSTWNVGGTTPHDDFDMEDWLDTNNNVCDIYVFGFQEIVPLTASYVLGSENSQISMKWNSLIRRALNKKHDIINRSNPMEELRVDHELHSTTPQDFHCIISKQMVGILISVWVSSNLHPHIRHPSVSCIGCGIMGCLGNKGSVSVRFLIHETSFCFVCSHLASGGREGDEKLRNSDVAEILARTRFPRGPLLDLPRNILDHDRVILLGDLNYRISLPEATVRLLVDKNEWIALLEKDQLSMELMKGQVFEGWHEGAIKFAPTYKYCHNSNSYFGCVGGQKAVRWRAPAWCDRIIWYGQGLKQHLYTRGESNLSDHRPVKATFTAQAGFSQALKGVEKFSISERFERSPSQTFQYNGRSSFKI